MVNVLDNASIPRDSFSDVLEVNRHCLVSPGADKILGRLLLARLLLLVQVLDPLHNVFVQDLLDKDVDVHVLVRGRCLTHML